MLLRDQAVKDIALERPGATAIFRRNRIDFCCNGARSLNEAAAARGIATDVLEAELAALTPGPIGDLPTEPDALIDLILRRFHEVHRVELVELVRLAARVEAVHRDHPDCPTGLAAFLSETANELEDHMMKEEAVLFPMLKAGHGAMAGMPIARMRSEHLEHGERLEELARLTTDFTPPAGACTTWRALYAGCAKLDGDLREHIHIENNVLFALFDRDGVVSACGCGGKH
ncbi:MAG TPA: iron-sulfur cluster repair di-iron protein [Hyphomonadaceae bacterium]|nr:iron-sulfur cluster repair di-iron protein [Hyphomonadaceae bacterium]